MASAKDVQAQWKAPAGDEQLVLWPEAGALLAQTRENHQRLSAAAGVMIQNLPLSQLRRDQRLWLGHGDDRPLIATGHQVELHHPGVWAKDVLINALAARLEGEAYHFAVDTDAPRHLHLRWPGASWPITDDPRLATAYWAGALGAPTEAHLAHLSREIAGAAAAWDFRPMALDYLQNLRRLVPQSDNLIWVLVAASHELDRQLGLRQHAALVSPMLLSPGYLAFVHHILARADSFMAVYNAVLNEYRQEMGISNPGRPWPNLRCEAGACEAPFWLDCLESGQRRRAMVLRAEGRWVLRPNQAQFELDPSADGYEAARSLGRFLQQNNLRLSPRALTLTAFIRLLVADQFVHGIGGGRYDLITDRVINSWFGMQAPAFSVTTATLLFPSAAGQAKVDVRRIHEEGRRLRHQWFSQDKRRLARRIAKLPPNSEERRRLFYQMHHELDRVVRSPEYQAWQQRFAQARRAVEHQEQIFDRELFYGLQPESRLLGLIERYRSAVTSPSAGCGRRPDPGAAAGPRLC
jgi:hypothetical protein